MNSDPFMDAVDDWCARDEWQFADRNAAWLFFFKAGQASVAATAVPKQTRADALREAAGICELRAEGGEQRMTSVAAEARSCKAAILSLIDQPQEDVCEWVECGENNPKANRTLWKGACGDAELFSQRGPFGICRCGKPIKVKE